MGPSPTGDSRVGEGPVGVIGVGHVDGYVLGVSQVAVGDDHGDVIGVVAVRVVGILVVGMGDELESVGGGVDLEEGGIGPSRYGVSQGLVVIIGGGKGDHGENVLGVRHGGRGVAIERGEDGNGTEKARPG